MISSMLMVDQSWFSSGRMTPEGSLLSQMMYATSAAPFQLPSLKGCLNCSKQSSNSYALKLLLVKSINRGIMCFSQYFSILCSYTLFTTSGRDCWQLDLGSMKLSSCCSQTLSTRVLADLLILTFCSLSPSFASKANNFSCLITVSCEYMKCCWVGSSLSLNRPQLFINSCSKSFSLQFSCYPLDFIKHSM